MLSLYFSFNALLIISGFTVAEHDCVCVSS